ncbi:MAG: dihydroorotase [Lachnospiraceae bacterium]|nr:dihydroorotase [Lachnospiraceae bacterium]
MIRIKNGHVCDPKSGFDNKADIYISQGKIKAIVPVVDGVKAAVPSFKDNASYREINAEGMVVAPGLVDVHSHFRDPGFTYKEDIISGAKAAAAGGYTSVVLMCNTKPCVDNEATLKYVLDKGKKTGINVYSCANVSMGMRRTEPVPMEELAALGAKGFTDDGLAILNEDLVIEAMKRAAKLKLPISFHEEDPRMIVNSGINRGRVSEYLALGGAPREAEYTLVARDINLCERYGATIDIQHVSCKETVDYIRRAKERGVDVHAEATPQHFTLTEEAVLRYKANAKINPPLREEADRRAIIEGLRDNTIDMIATDHAPHSTEEKSRELTEAPSGIIGLETALALGVTILVNNEGFSLMTLLERMTVGPAKVYGLDAGYIAEGGPADLCIFDPAEVVIPCKYKSKSENSPFTGWELRGKVFYTICAGKVVYEAM